MAGLWLAIGVNRTESAQFIETFKDIAVEVFVFEDRSELPTADQYITFSRTTEDRKIVGYRDKREGPISPAFHASAI